MHTTTDNDLTPAERLREIAAILAAGILRLRTRHRLMPESAADGPNVRLKQRKRAKPIADFLQRLGVPPWRAWILACSGKGWWRMAGSPQAAEAMTIRWFQELGLVRLTVRYAELQP